MSRPSFKSASGLRPASAYLMIGCALIIVCGKSWVLALQEEHHQPLGTERQEVLPAPDFDIVDRNRSSLALSVQRMNLRLSPRSMWQAHTPLEIAAGIIALIDDELLAEELMANLFPSAQDGVIRVVHEDWRLGYEEANRVEAWANELGIDHMLWLVRANSRPLWRIHWRPLELLSSETRARHSSGGKTIAPIVWTRRLADGLCLARKPEGDGDDRPLTWKQLEKRRSTVWRAMIPCADTIAIHELPPSRVLDLIDLLDDEYVQKQQMTIEFEHDRVYPVREELEFAGAWNVLGKWGYIDEVEAGQLAALKEPDPKKRARKERELLDIKRPRSGFEWLAADFLARVFPFITPVPARYRYRKSVAVHQKSRRYYFDDESEGPTPKVLTTLDSDLQEFLHSSLRKTVEEHRAAVAMGIIIEVESGDVLAIDGCSDYEVSEFLPTWHLFSPGSTFKVVVMASALEARVVTPDEEFFTYNGNYSIPNSRRVIHEARGAPTGRIPAWKAISRSVNAVMVQIGMRVPAPFFRRKLVELGYNRLPASGIGTERLGHLPELPWKHAYTHASISFGHELSVNLWQHAAALATILRGGRPRPLRLITGVEWGDEHYRLYLEEGERVFSESTSSTVRWMMAEGALTGTGRHISRRERELGTRIELVSKTGTTEKEPGVPCLHLELKRNEHNAHLPGGRHDPDFETFAEMKRRKNPHSGSCYTSSICLAGRVPGEEREVLVFLVVDEPRSKMKFGSEVAGPAAANLLKEALGLTEGGVSVAERSAFVQSYGYEVDMEGAEHPWLMRSATCAPGGESSW